MTPFTRFCRGFTLIELLIVVAILSTVAMISFSVSDDDRAQLRYHDTRQRLQSIERAILGHLGPSESKALSGFVADNGNLPSDLLSLLSAGSLLPQAAQTPIFDPLPDGTTCANNGSHETALSDASALLIKGHRGNYLGGLAVNQKFRDGWGNEHPEIASDAKNFGWIVDTAVTQQLTLSSLGADNATGGSDYAADASSKILATDWRVPIAGWTIGVHNRSGSDLSATTYLAASLLVFVNNSSGGYWQQFSSNTTSVACLDGNGDGLVSGSSCGSSVTLSFPALPCAATGSIPQGRHLLVLVRRNAASGSSSADAPYFWSSSSSRPVAAQITAIAGMTLPETVLEIR